MGNVAADLLKVIVFDLNNEEYALPVEHIGAIERMHKITRVPQTASFVKGVINLRGVVIPVIDLRTRFGIAAGGITADNRMIIVSLQTIEVGIIVDGAKDVIDLPKNRIEAPPEVFNSVPADYVQGVVRADKRLIVLLDLEKVLATTEVLLQNQK